MAAASLAFGFLGLLPPFGLAAVVLGHLSRRQIAKSRRRESGTGIAFAGLILGYGQLAIFTTLLLGLLGFVNEIRQDLAKHPDTRLALLDRIAHGDPYHVTPQRSARQEQTAIQAHSPSKYLSCFAIVELNCCRKARAAVLGLTRRPAHRNVFKKIIFHLVLGLIFSPQVNNIKKDSLTTQWERGF